MRCWTLALILAMLLSLAGCGGKGGLKPDIATTPGSIELAALDAGDAEELVVTRQGFRLTVSEESFVYEGRATFDLAVSEAAGITEVTVSAEAEALKACYLELAYDAELLRPLDCNEGEWPGFLDDEMLRVTVLDRPGAVHHGTVLVHPQDSAGVSGEFVPLRASFTAGPAVPRHEPLAVPDVAGSSVPDLRVDRDTGEVTFSYCNLGDYNQNSLVEVADLTPIGVHFDMRSDVFPDPFPFESVASVVDGNGNGLIEVADITPLGQNFGKRVTEWRVYGGDLTDFPLDAATGNGAAELLDTIAFDASATLPHEARLVYNETYPQLVGYGEEVVWLRPRDDEGAEGIPSDCFAYDQALDTTPPEWTYGSPGVLMANPLDGTVRVIWSQALDRESPPVTYTVYYNEGDVVDFGTALTATLVASDPPDQTVDQVMEVGGLTNGTQYAFAVRASDSASVINEDDNTFMLAARPQPEQEMPATISGETTFDGPMRVSTGNEVVVTGGEAVHFLSDLTVEDGGSFKGETDDMLLIVDGNLLVDGALDHDLSGYEHPEGEEDTRSLMIVARGDFTFGPTSTIMSDGNLYIVDDESELVSPEEAAYETTYDTDPAYWACNMMLEPEEPPAETMQLRSAEKAVSRTVRWPAGPNRQRRLEGEVGPAPAQKKDVHRVISRFACRGEMQLNGWTITGPPGTPGEDRKGHDVTGGPGKKNVWHLSVLCTGTMWIHSATVNFGDGGRGGNAENLDQYPEAKCTGGPGGDAENKFRFAAARGIVVDDLNLDPGKGGQGGNAAAVGRNGTDGPGPGNQLTRIGGHARAFGGDGGDARWVVKKRGNVSTPENIKIGIVHGGAGGEANAQGARGGHATDCANPEGGRGGWGKAVGGIGGKGTYIDGRSGGVGGGARGGKGGKAIAKGGDGGDAVDCCGGPGGLGANANATGGRGGYGWLIGDSGDVKGGDGGDAEARGGIGGVGADCVKKQGGIGGVGGNAEAIAGEGGMGNETNPSGTDGNATAESGNGGPGGEGVPPGAGADPGEPTAEGEVAIEIDGVRGNDGQIPWAKFSWDQILFGQVEDPSGADWDDLPAGDYQLPMNDAHGVDGEIGTSIVQLELSGETPFGLVNVEGHFGIEDGPTVLSMPPDSMLRIRREDAEFTNQNHDKPWIGATVQWFANENPPDTEIVMLELLRDGEPVCEPFEIPLIEMEWDDSSKQTSYLVLCEVDQWWDELVISRFGGLGGLFIEWIRKLDP